jgi:hypothetical protein
MQKGRGLNRCASSTLYLCHTKGGLINHCLLMKWDCPSLVVILYYHHVDRKNVTKSITINKVHVHIQFNYTATKTNENVTVISSWGELVAD